MRVATIPEREARPTGDPPSERAAGEAAGKAAGEAAVPTRRPKPRILCVDYSIGFGGAIKSLGLVLRRIDGAVPLVLTSQDAAIIDRWLPGIRVSQFRRVVNYTLGPRLASALGGWSGRLRLAKVVALLDVATTWINTVRIGWLLRRERIDVVHLNNGFVPLEALRAARLLRVPVVVHLRDFHRDPARLRSSGAQRVACIVAVSDAVAASLDGSAVAARPRRTIHDPVDLASIDAGAAARDRVRSECGVGDDDVAVAIFGRVTSWKGQLEFVRAIIPAMNDDPRIRAIIVGDQSDSDRSYFDAVRNEALGSNVGSRFVFTGYRPNVEEYYAAMDVAVHASTSPEPFGMVVPEAMAAGCAVLAMDAGGPREVITHGVDGLLVPPGDPLALGAAISAVCADDALRARLAAAARRTARTRSSVEACARELTAVYDLVLATSRAERGGAGPGARSGRAG